jgi:asparagine synthase (glutamine-hydrolysing)
MCGIAGIRTFDGNDPEPIALAMATCLAHRGPDDHGIFVDKDLALGFRRLSIIDLSRAGAQPMTSASGRFVIVFNGEVYNAERLRAELPSPEWRGHSDTEVMLACIEAWGLERAVERFIGMFAFALWDRTDRKLILVRDRLGVKPLYYAHTATSFQFASELKALQVDRSIDHAAVALYARYGYVPAPFSIYRNVRKLPPGCMLTFFTDGRVDIRSYWNAARVAERVERFRGSEADALAQLDELLADSIRLRMIADVPLGLFLSGGIDSSIVAAHMQRAASAPISTFTIGFEDARFDEAPHAAAIAKHLGTNHHEQYVRVADALATIPQLGSIYDEPFGDSSAIPTLLVSRMARPNVTVALSGDGGDELFGGYHRYFLGARNSRRVARVPRGLRKPLGRTLRHVGRFEGVASALILDDPVEVFLRQVANPDLLTGAEEGTFALTDRTAWPRLEDPVELMMVLDAMSYLPDDILTKVDRASMSVSLEVREPLLDHRLVEFAWSLPLSMKIRDDRGKWILREALRRDVPDALIDREKQGFGLPVAEWLRGPLREWAESLIAKSEHFDAKRVRELWASHLAGRDEAAIWRVLSFEQWLATIAAP